MMAFRIGIAGAVIAALGVFGVAPAHALFDQEVKCSNTLGKSFNKYHASVLKTLAKCHNDDISGKANSVDACETLTVDQQAAITKARDKFLKKVNKDCVSECTVSADIPCVSDLGCPARHLASPPNNSASERCLGEGGSNPFSLRNLDWPGPYCASVLGHTMNTPGDMEECVLALAERTIDAVDEAVWADLDETSMLSDTAVKCLSSISKSVTKAIPKMYGPAAACRTIRRDADSSTTPVYACALDDPSTISASESVIAKLVDTVEKKCSDTDIASLTGLCEPGAAPTTKAEAQACLSTFVEAVSNRELGVNNRGFAPFSMINITHPHSAVAFCGDGVVTAKREEHTGVGEECDGSDAPCGGGSCIPPGDLFECTCDNVARERLIVNGDASSTDSDAGWMGSSHEATHNDGFGYVSELSNCTCDAFSQATCTTPSGDDECDVVANMAPRCSDDFNGPDSCDDRGNGDGSHIDSDCFRCDDFSLNAGTWCANGNNPNETLCQSQCIVDATGLPTMPATPCINQDGCGEGETCRGRCDNTITCEKMTEGSPLPLVSANTFVCIMLEYQTDIVGTKNIVTGETALNYTTESNILLGESFDEPCPVCAGVCVSGPNNGDHCYGRCNASAAPCLAHADCSGMGDTACLESNAECPGGFCSLDLRCSSGPNEGGLCRPDDETNFGVVSHDCPSGNPFGKIFQPFGTVTTEEVEFPVGGACTDPAWINYDCPCPADVFPNTGVPTKPNDCSAACDGGVNAGQGCVIGGGGNGEYTTCVGGVENGKPCDADSDCDSANCSGQAQHCTAGTTSLLGSVCTTNGDCGGGGLCEPPCPGGRCVPLCLQAGECNGGGRDGDPCSTLDQCKECTAGNPAMIGQPCESHSRCNTTPLSGDGFCEAMGGVTCDITDPEDGYCAAGPTRFYCNGQGFETQNCQLRYGTCEANVCTMGSPSLRGQPCTVPADCEEVDNVPVSSGCETGVDALPGTADDIPGAGECEPVSQNCFFDNGRAEGGDTLNGEGSPSDVNINSCFCVPPSDEPAVNSASGFGGPSRIRRQGSAIVNVPSIP
jgi:hypothetical protein